MGPAPETVFFALSDPTRLRIVELLADAGELRVTDLAGQLAVSRQAVAKHLAVLHQAGMTTTQRRGRERLSSLRSRALDPMRSWLERYDRFWDQKLGALKALIEERQER